MLAANIFNVDCNTSVANTSDADPNTNSSSRPISISNKHNRDNSFDSKPARKRVRVTINDFGRYQKTTTKGFYYMATYSTNELTNACQIKMNFLPFCCLNYFFFESTDLFSLINFPYSAIIVAFVMFPEKVRHVSISLIFSMQSSV